VRQMAADGHELACHTETHRSLADLDEEDCIRELFGPISVVHELTGSAPRYFRPPGGNISTETRRIAARFGLTPVMWTANCGPYEGGAPEVMEQYVASAPAGSVVLMHNCEATTLRALPAIGTKLRQKGVAAVPLSSLLGR